ncbi:MAG: hypothetical protein NVSMB4_00180 [Acidimicrobiales bacterium]
MVGISGSRLVEQAITATRAALDAADGLVAAGWTRQDTLPTFSVSIETEEVAGDALSAAVDELRPLLIAATLVARWGSDFLTLECAASGTRPLLVTGQSHGTLQATFSNDDLPVAEAAFNGDVAAALRLVATWHAVLNVDPARCLSSSDPSRHWLVLPDVASVQELVGTRPWWELKPLVQPGRPLVVAIRDAKSDIDIRTKTQRICSLSLVAPGANAELEPSTISVGQWSMQAAPPGTPSPDAIHPYSFAGQDAELPSLLRTLRRQATACCWALLATSVTIQGNEAQAEFFGLQRQAWTLPAGGPDLTPEAHEAAYELWRTCIDGALPDRLLAARQVVSLYRQAPWASAADVLRSSEPLFLALRSTATAEALRAQREARALAMSVARQTAEATTGLAKNAVERALAVFAAMGAIIVARTSSTLTATQATSLRHLLAIYLLILVPWSFILEGRPVTAAIGALRVDLASFSDLLTDSEQSAILRTETVQRSQQQAWAARCVVPLAYLAAAIVALTLRG